MARRKSGALAGLLIAALVLALLAALNPSQADFKAYLGRQASQGIQNDTGKKLASLLGGAPSGLFKRTDYLFASSYSLANKEGSAYLGFAKVVFLKLR